MDNFLQILLSWQFLLVSLVVFLIFAAFNQVLGPFLWQYRELRPFLKVSEAFKLIWPPLLGFGLGWLDDMPRPESLQGESRLTIACVYAVAGLGSQWVVKAIKKAVESRGISTADELPPREQRKRS